MARHYLFTSESVTEGHPDKICDQISDAVLDAILEKDPQARVACETTVNDRIGGIGTEAPGHSGIYTSFIRRQKPDVQVVSKACPLFVPLVEEGWLKDPITMEVARRYLEELLQYDIDTLILGCTHYPFIKGAFARNAKRYLRGNCTLIDGSVGTVRQLERILDRYKLRNPIGTGRVEFHTSGDTSQVTSLINRSESIVEVVKSFRMCFGSGCVTELYVRELSCGLNDVILMAEAVCKYEVAAGICQLAGSVICFLTLGNTGFKYILDSHFLTGFLCGVDEVQVVGGILVMQENETCLYGCTFIRTAGHADRCAESKHYCCGCCNPLNTLFHCFVSFTFTFYSIVV